MYINQMLNDYVVANGIKQIYISKKTGIDTNTISLILTGKRRILADEFLLICIALNLDPNYFRNNSATATKTEDKPA
ncbi:MAG: helix-turn-helix transcriptional regulator [Clostridia bacterium]|nr:helix-turn-helix transcriptional regulator [Clostridia bacterium]